MASYRKNEAREWAREHLRGCANVIIPSFTQDLKALMFPQAEQQAQLTQAPAKKQRVLGMGAYACSAAPSPQALLLPPPATPPVVERPMLWNGRVELPEAQPPVAAAAVVQGVVVE